MTNEQLQCFLDEELLKQQNLAKINSLDSYSKIYQSIKRMFRVLAKYAALHPEDVDTHRRRLEQHYLDAIDQKIIELESKESGEFGLGGDWWKQS